MLIILIIISIIIIILIIISIIIWRRLLGTCAQNGPIHILAPRAAWAASPNYGIRATTSGSPDLRRSAADSTPPKNQKSDWVQAGIGVT